MIHSQYLKKIFFKLKKKQVNIVVLVQVSIKLFDSQIARSNAWMMQRYCNRNDAVDDY